MAIEFPASAILSSGSPPIWQAFLKGYGVSLDLYEDRYGDFLSYVLLRAVGRYPNGFVSELGSFIRDMLDHNVTLLR